MTSAKVMLSVATLMGCLVMSGCSLFQGDKAPPLEAPYADTQTWAVAPLRNESGSQQVDVLRVADHLTRQFEEAQGLSAVPVNRVIAAMESLELPELTNPEEAALLRETLGVDALVVGTVTAYDPYDPPELGLALELYTGPQIPRARIEIRKLTAAPTDETAQPREVDPGQPVTIVSGHYDAGVPRVRERLQDYGHERGAEASGDGGWRRYRLSMDLYTEFVSYVAGERLLDAERQRLQPPATSTLSAP